MNVKYGVYISYESKVIANVKVDNRQTNRQTGQKASFDGISFVTTYPLFETFYINSWGESESDFSRKPKMLSLFARIPKMRTFGSRFVTLHLTYDRLSFHYDDMLKSISKEEARSNEKKLVSPCRNRKESTQPQLNVIRYLFTFSNGQFDQY